MFSPVKLSNQSTFRYGLGWWLPVRNGISFYYHNGVTGPEFLKIPSHGLDIIVLSNLGQGDYDEVHYWGLADKIAGFILPEFRHNPQQVSYLEEEVESYVGDYEYAEGGELKIYLKGGQLYLRDSYGEAALIHLGNATFTLREDPVIFQFINKDQIMIQEETWTDDYAHRVSGN